MVNAGASGSLWTSSGGGTVTVGSNRGEPHFGFTVVRLGPGRGVEEVHAV